jgi:hypothetical protein
MRKRIVAALLLVVAFGAALLLVSGRPSQAANPVTFTFVNNSGRTIWVGALGNAGKGQPNNGGWAMSPGQTMTVSVAADWAGRFWGRTGCSFDGSGHGTCQTGDCGGVLACNGAGGIPPASLAEFTLGNGTASDFYDVSFVDGFNVPMTVQTVGGTPNPSDPYRCTDAGCGADLNPGCPSELRKTDGSGQTVACMSACEAFNTDQYCCRGQYGSPQTCVPSQWPVNYAAYFKSACPHAYSYAYDDPTSTFTCQNCGYRIVFGPSSGGGGGGGGGLTARSTIQAEAANAQSGTATESTTDTGGGQDVGWIANGDWLRFDNVDFSSTAATQFTARVASGAATGVSGLVQVRLDSVSGPVAASFAVANTGGWQSWRSVPANLSATTGTHTVYVTFASGQPADFVNLNWLTFS